MLCMFSFNEPLQVATPLADIVVVTDRLHLALVSVFLIHYVTVITWTRAGSFIHLYFMYRDVFCFYYLCVYIVNRLFSVKDRVRVWYYFIFCDRYMKYWPSYCTSVQLKRPRAVNELSVRAFCCILYQVVLMRVLTFAPSTLTFVLCVLTFGPCMVANACCACFPSMNYSTCRHCGCHPLHLALVNASLIRYAILCVSLHY